MSGCRVVLADDHEMFRAGLKSLLVKEKDIRVVAEAADGERLLAALEEVPCDLVVLDLFMPQMDGILVLKRIRRKFPKIKILVLTMHNDLEHFKHTMTLGAAGYVVKDDAFEELVVAIKTVMRGKSYVASPVSTLLTENYLHSLDDREQSSLEILTKRERQILGFIAQGMANKNIAQKLGISTRTVEAHRAHLSHKLGIKHAAGLVKFALSKGLI